MSLLTLIQEAADTIGIPQPTFVINSNDAQVRQLLAAARNEGRHLSRRHDWQAMIREATITTVAAEEQGEVATLFPGMRYLTNETGWNRSTQEPLGGPLNGREWQSLKAFTVTGPYYDFRIREGKLLFIPTPPAGEDVRFEYLSNYWCESSGGNGQSGWLADTDVGVLSEELMSMGVVWRYRRMKGFDYSEEFAEYEELVSTDIAADGARRTLRMDEDHHYERWPTARAPVGSWNL